jgi:hypothetical protein
MIAKPFVVAMTLLSSSFALAASPGIGTVSTRGEIKVGGYAVRGTATLFDDTNVETNQFAATMRLDKGAEIKLGTGSSGTLYRDRLVLSRGETQLTTASSFQLEANGLSISTSTPNTVGIISLSPQKTVQVAALKGELRVMDSHHALLAEVSEGASRSFPNGTSAQDSPSQPQNPPIEPAAQSAPPVQAAGPQTISDIGLLSSENGHYYLESSSSGIKYEISGNNLAKFVGDKVIIEGTVLSGTAAQPQSVAIKSIVLNGPPVGMTKLGKILFASAIAGGAATVGYVIDSASR